MIDPAHITHGAVLEAFSDAMRRRVGRGDGKVGADALADATGFDVRTILSWRDGENVPCFHRVLRLCAYFGPVFTSEVLRPAGQGGVEDIAPVTVDPQAAATDMVTAAGQMLERLRDGRFCHMDRAVMGPLLIEMSRALEAQGRAMTGKEGGTL